MKWKAKLNDAILMSKLVSEEEMKKSTSFPLERWRTMGVKSCIDRKI